MIKNYLTRLRHTLTLLLYSPPYRLPFMKKINRINPIAKELPKFGKRIIPDKRRVKEDKQVTKEIRDAKTKQDS